MYTASGIILKREDYRERDERIFLYTKEFGKMSVVAKGTKRIEAKLRGSLDIFNFVDIIFVEGRYFFILISVETRKRYPNIIADAHCYSAALSVASAITYIFQDNIKDKQFFDTIILTIKKLDECAARRERKGQKSSLDAWLIFKKFGISILENQGYRIDANTLSSLDISRPSENGMLLMGMLQGSDRESVRLSKSEFLNIEEMFCEIFGRLFGYRMPLWTPVVQKIQ